MISNNETTELQLAIESNEHQTVARLISPHSSEDLTSLQLFGNATLLMYACQRCDVEMVKLLLDKGVGAFELEWSDNNELKSVLENETHRNELLPLILAILPKPLAIDMINSDWNPDPDYQGELKSPIEIARDLSDKTCLGLLTEYLK